MKRCSKDCLMCCHEIESLPNYTDVSNMTDPNPNGIKVNTMIIDRNEWAPVRYGKGSAVASAETARDLLTQNAVKMIEKNGGLLVYMGEESGPRVCEVLYIMNSGG